MSRAFRVILLSLCQIFYLYSQGSLLLVGGGQENYNSWSDVPYRWFVQKANYGKIINIDVSAASSWYPSYFEWLGANVASHEMQIANRTAANDSVTYYELISAQGIFIEGGDQWDYVSTWKGTLVQDAIRYVFQNGGAVGGTSAGLAVLGDVVFDAKFGTAYPEQVAYNPYNSRVSFTDDFLDLFPNVLTDSHFHARGRLGRLVPMLARRIQDFGEESIMGVGVDVNTALCVEADLMATVFGEATVTILFKSSDSQILLAANQPVTFTHINYYQLNHSAVFDFQTRTLLDSGNYLHPLPPPPVETLTYIDTVLAGSDENIANLAEISITNLTAGTLTAWYGNLIQVNGLILLPRMVIIPRLWSDSDYYENRFIGGIWGAATHSHFTVLYLDQNTQSAISENGILTVDKLAYILETYHATHAGKVTFRNTNYSGIVAATLHFLGDQKMYDLRNHGPVVSIKTEDHYFLPVQSMSIYPYPNPFNSETTFRYHLPSSGRVWLKIFDVTGRWVDTPVKEWQPAGTHQHKWNAANLPSGIYFFQLTTPVSSSHGKCLLLK